MFDMCVCACVRAHKNVHGNDTNKEKVKNRSLEITEFFDVIK